DVCSSDLPAKSARSTSRDCSSPLATIPGPSCSRTRSSSTTRGTCSSTHRPREPISPGSSRQEISSTTPTGRRSPLRAPVARRHSMPSGTSPTSRSRRTSRPNSSSRDTSSHIQGVNMGNIQHVTDADFDEKVLKSDKPVLVDFWAEWCTPCRMIAPVLEEIASNQDKLDIVKLNTDENPELAAKYGITSIPALKVFDRGEVVKEIIGAKPKAALLNELGDYVN